MTQSMLFFDNNMYYILLAVCIHLLILKTNKDNLANILINRIDKKDLLITIISSNVLFLSYYFLFSKFETLQCLFILMLIFSIVFICILFYFTFFIVVFILFFVYFIQLICIIKEFILKTIIYFNLLKDNKNEQY